MARKLPSSTSRQPCIPTARWWIGGDGRPLRERYYGDGGKMETMGLLDVERFRRIAISHKVRVAERSRPVEDDHDPYWNADQSGNKPQSVPAAFLNSFWHRPSGRHILRSVGVAFDNLLVRKGERQGEDGQSTRSQENPPHTSSAKLA